MSDLTREESNTIATVLANLATSIAMTIPPANLIVAVKDVGEAAWKLWGEKNEAKRTELIVDIILAVICIIPCVGGAFRYSFKTVLRNPETYGPVLFYIVEGIISAIKSYYSSNPKLQMPETVKTLISHNPESLIDLIFSESKITSCLNDARSQVHKTLSESYLGSWIADDLDQFLASIIPTTMRVLQIAILSKIFKMKSMARNRRNSAVSNTSSHQNNSTSSSSTAANGKPSASSTNGNATSKPNGGRGGAPIYTSTVAEVTSKLQTYTASMKRRLSGGIGEHITDYYCYEVLKWGSTWSGHDQEKKGYWRKETSTSEPGKLNRYGASNKGGIMNKLQFVEAGTGIDGFWKLPVGMGKKYAVVESKSSMTAFTNSSIASSLGKLKRTERVNGRTCNVVQMSHSWIIERLKVIQNVPSSVVTDIRLLSGRGQLSQAYSRHLMITQLIDGAALKHLKACYDSVKGDMNLFTEIPEEHHRGHTVSRHIQDASLEAIINQRRFPPANSQSGQGNNRRK